MIADKSLAPYPLAPAIDKGWLPCVLIAACVGAVIAVMGGVLSSVILAALVAAALTLANYRFGLWFLVLLIPISAAPVFPRALFGIAGANPYNALLALTLLSFLAERALRRKGYWLAGYRRFWWAYMLPVCVAVLIGTQHFSEIPAFAFVTGPVHFTTLGGYVRDIFLKPMLYLVVALLLGIAVREGMKPTAVIVALCLSLWVFAAWVTGYILASGVGLGQLASATNREALSGTGMHANDLGNLAAAMLTLMLFAIAGARRAATLRWLYAATAGLAAALLLISFSRGAWLAFAVGLTAFFVMQRRLSVVLVGLLVIACALPLLPTEIYERVTTGIGTGGSLVLHSSDDPLTAGRVAGIWFPLFSEVREHPFFGNGLFAIAWSEPFRTGAMRLATLNPHNLYLKLLLEVGIVGLILVLWFFADLWRRFRAAGEEKSTSREAAWLFSGAAAALLGYAVFGLTGGDYLPETANFWLWIAFGLVLSTRAGGAIQHQS